MKFMVKKCLFTVLIMSASVSLPMFNGQQGQGQVQPTLDPNDPVVQALNFYQCTNTLLSAGKSLYEVVKPAFGLAGSLDVPNPWRKDNAEGSFDYVHRILQGVTILYGKSLYAHAYSSKLMGQLQKFVKESILEDYSKDFHSLYGKDCLDRVIKSCSNREEWKGQSQQELVQEKKLLEEGLKAICAAKSIDEKKKLRKKLLLKLHPDKAGGNLHKAKRHTLYTGLINKVAVDQGVTNKG